MSVWKGTLYFGQGKYGWSECFYLDSETAGGSLRKLLHLADARSALLGSGADLTRAEVSAVGAWRMTLASGVAVRNLPEPAANPLDGLIIRMTSIGGAHDGSYRRTMLLRGLPEVFFLSHVKGDAALNPRWSAKLREYFDVLSNGDFHIQAASKDFPWFPIQSIHFSPADVTDNQGHPLPPPHPQPTSWVANLILPDSPVIPRVSPLSGKASRVFVRGCKLDSPHAARTSGLNGLHPLVSSLPGLVTLAGFPSVPGKYQGGGFLQMRETLFVPIQSVEYGSAGNRSCGRPQYPVRSVVLQSLDFGNTDSLLPEVEEGGREGWGPFAQSSVIHNARDLVAWVYQGYEIGETGLPLAISIAPIANRPGVWLVGLSGTDLVSGSDTGIIADVNNGLGLPSTYANRLHDAILKTVPKGDSLIIAGHSLGGMVGQNMVRTATASRTPIDQIITFGSPLTVYQDSSVEYRMFAHPHDFVINTTPLGLIMAALDHPEQTFVPYHLVPDQPFLEHTEYPANPALQAWGADGTLVGSDPEIAFTLGPLSRFPVPVE